MPIDLTRRRFIIGAFASVAGVAAAAAFRVDFIQRPNLTWEEMLVFLGRTMPNHRIEDHSTSAHFVSITQALPRVICPPKMLVGWDVMEWGKLAAPEQQRSIEFIDQNMKALRRDMHMIAGSAESLIRDDSIGIWAHADA